MNAINIKFKKSFECSIIVENGVFKNSGSILESFSADTQFIIITDKNIINHYEGLIHNTFQSYQYSIIISITGEKAKVISRLFINFLKCLAMCTKTRKRKDKDND